MFDRLDDMLIHYEELMLMLGDPAVTQDTKRFTRLMKEQADLAPIEMCIRDRFSICRKHGVLVVSDEIHQDFTYEGKPFVSSACVKDGGYKDILITLNSGSKTFNLA